MSTGIVRVRTTAPAARVHEALTTAEGLRAWLAEHAAVDLEQGTFEFWGRYTPEGERGRQKLSGRHELEQLGAVADEDATFLDEPLNG